ncbi:gelsolin-related protein of 125 kDa-like isoform X2 [Toxotes jaculatrix]|uniref:gelsolin-related protein of 125 kDa-like isoform X2 n=1 Tax=Toxotes jaculatrix TaxID=941984 RepID=UPI001B3A7CDA|nr:gelsolin-related protein of 125 kDa-like isoform X2 [Toxotes jaculatrix]
MKRNCLIISDDEDDDEEDRDRRNSLRKKKRVRYIEDDEDVEEEDDDDEEEEEEEEEEDWEDSEKPASSTTHNQGAPENRLLPVTCGNKKGTLDVQKLGRGEECILCEGRWFAPSAFEGFGGKGSSKKWKATIFHKEKPLQILFQKGILTTKRFKRGSASTKPKKILPSNQDSESPSEASAIQNAEETEEDDVKDDDWCPSIEELAVETEEGKEESVGAENKEEVVDSGDDKSKEEDKMEKGEMENEDFPTFTDNDYDSSVFEERERDLNISASMKNVLQTVKIVLPRLRETLFQTKSDHQYKCTEPAEDSWSKPLDEDTQSEEERQHNGSAVDDFSVATATHTHPLQMPDVPPTVGEVQEENGEMGNDERKDGQTEMKAEHRNSPRPQSAPATSSPDIRPDTGSISDHTANFRNSPVLLGATKAEGEEREDEALEMTHCTKKETEPKRNEHLDESNSETSFQTGNTDVTTNIKVTQWGIKYESTEAVGPPTKLHSAPVECKYENLGCTDAITYDYDAAQLQDVRLETRELQTAQTSDSTYSSDMEEGPSISINPDTMELNQLKREKIKMQLKVLKLQEEYYTLKINELKK